MPMRPNLLRQKLNAGEPTLCTRLLNPLPRFAELVGAQGGYDYIEYVTEYSTFHMYDLDHVCRAADLYGLGTMVKIDQANQQFVAQRAIGAGFQAILFTDCRSAEDVRECVRICRPDTPEDGGYYPAAMRRNSLVADADGEDYVQAARDVVVCVMIEKRGAVEEIDEILQITGLDLIQWGGTDYAMNLGLAFRRDDPKVDAARRKVFEAALASSVPPRAEVSGPESAEEYKQMGVRHFSVGGDLTYVSAGWKRDAEQMGAFMADLGR